DLANRISKLKHQLELAGGVDESTIREYKETQERFDYLETQSNDLNLASTDLKSVIEELDGIIKKQFDQAFERISEKFTEYFRILFNGGRAQMSLLRENQEQLAQSEETEAVIAPVDGVRQKKTQSQIIGIEIKATPPGKKLAAIASLS